MQRGFSVAADIRVAIARALKKLGIFVADHNIQLEHPATLENGDYATGAALKYAKQVDKKPRELAEEIVKNLGGIKGISKIETAGAGFINFFLASSELARSVELAIHKSDLWGKNETNKGKKVMVEYTDPNPFKEFHIGHLMSNAIGESVSRLIEFSGAEVKRANYQGDVGPHVAKAIWGKMQKKESTWGEAYARGSNEYENHKEEIDALNRKIYDKTDEAVNRLYIEGRKESLEHFEVLYKVLGTKFDYYFFESESAPKGVELVRANPDVFVESEGAIVYHGSHTRVFITSKGLPTYEAKELGLAEMKAAAWPFDMSITVTAHEQSGYFEVVLAAMREILPDLAKKLRHITHGMMRLPSGKMSSRTGEVITGESLLEDLIREAKARAKESRAEDYEKLAQDVAVGAIKYQILKQASGRDIIFDRDRALSLDGDSGPYLQYAHARAHALLEKAKEQDVSVKVDVDAQSSELSRLLHRFPEAVEYAAEKLEPHLLTNYLLELASMFNRWYANEHILDGTPAASHKVAIVDAVRSTLKNGLWLLGIPAPERM